VPRNDSLNKFSGRDGIAFHGLTFSGYRQQLRRRSAVP